MRRRLQQTFCNLARAPRAAFAAAGVLACLGLSCAGAVREAAKSAAPAAVESAIDEAQDPETRDNLAQVLADPQIRDAASRLSASIVEGAMLGLGDAERSAQLQQVADTLVARFGASFARSLERDIGPQLATTLASAVQQSLERALDAHTEQRVEALAAAMTRGAMQGLGELTAVDASGQQSPVLRQAVGELAREASRQAALGFQDAVQQSREQGDADGAVLASFGALSDVTRLAPLLLLLGLVLLLSTALAALAWSLWRLRRERRASRAHEAAALGLAQALQATKSSAVSQELREHIERVARREEPGAERLRQLLREQAELERGAREPPASERSAYAG